MSEILLIAISASLVNTLLLANLLEHCPPSHSSRHGEAGWVVSVAMLLTVTLLSGLAYLTCHWLLEPLGLQYLRTLVLLLLVAVAAPLAAATMRAMQRGPETWPRAFVALIATNCALLGVALPALEHRNGLLGSLVFGVSAGLGFGVVLVTFIALHERLDVSEVPRAFRGPPIVLVTAGLMALAFAGFRGLGTP
jgi:H+/Na+-translocating ferredoxin:NAD+ oxidoreductase subunit A